MFNMWEFRADVLKSWCAFNFYHQKRVENQYIWYNSWIRIKGCPFFWRDTYNKGLKFVYQLFRNQSFKSFEEVKIEFGLTPMRFNSLKAAIPADWKDFFVSTSSAQYHPIAPHSYDTYCLAGAINLSRKVYAFLNGDELLLHNKYLKWKEEIGQSFSEGILDFISKHNHIYKVTNVPKFRSFQYRLLQRGLVTNITLYKWKFIESDLCTFGKMEKESLSHLFWLCPIVRNLWEEVKMFIEDRFNIDIDLNVVTIILNELCVPISHVGNFICLITKQYIYRQRCMKKELNFVQLKAQIA